MKKILFVCLGNICRSSAAEGVMNEFLKKYHIDHLFEVDSAGLIDYHEGELSDPRMRAHARDRGYNLIHRSRPVTTSDLEKFDFIFGMDHNNISGLKRLASDQTQIEKIELFANYCKEHDASVIPDPYYGGPEDFEYVLDLLEDACEQLCILLKEDLGG